MTDRPIIFSAAMVQALTFATHLHNIDQMEPTND